MYTDLFTPESLAELKTAFVTQFPMALWESFYVTVLSTALAVVLGLPLGVLLVVGEKEAGENTFAVRKRGAGEIGSMNADEFMQLVIKEDKEKAIW